MSLKWFKNYDENSEVEYIAINPKYVVSVLKDLPAPDGTELTQVYMLPGMVYTVVGNDIEIATELSDEE